MRGDRTAPTDHRQTLPDARQAEQPAGAAPGGEADPRPYLAALTMVRRKIWMNEPATEQEAEFIRMAAPKEFATLSHMTYEEIRRHIEKFRRDPGFGPDVELALSPRGERWIRHALGIFRMVKERSDDDDQEEPAADGA